MISAKFEVNYSLWKKKMGLYASRLIPYASTMAERLADVAFAMVKAKTPVTKGTNIRELWEVEHTKTAAKEQFVVKNLYKNQDVILFMEVGTVPHNIVPVNCKVLRFFIGGREIHTKRVWHPGTVPHRMVYQAEQYVRPKMDWYTKQVFAQADKINRAR